MRVKKLNMMMQKMMDLSTQLISAKNYTKALNEEINSLRRINEILRRDKSNYLLEKTHWDRTSNILFDLTELHVEEMKRMKMDLSKMGGHKLAEKLSDTVGVVKS